MINDNALNGQIVVVAIIAIIAIWLQMDNRKE